MNAVTDLTEMLGQMHPDRRPGSYVFVTVTGTPATAVLTLTLVVVYVLVARSLEGPGGAWWYVAVLLVAAVMSVVAGVTGRARWLMPGTGSGSSGAGR